MEKIVEAINTRKDSVVFISVENQDVFSTETNECNEFATCTWAFHANWKACGKDGETLAMMSDKTGDRREFKFCNIRAIDCGEWRYDIDRFAGEISIKRKLDVKKEEVEPITLED